MDWKHIFGDEEPAEVFRYFSMISEIPRRSGDLRRISDFLLAFGCDLGLESRQDGALNVIIEKNASPDYEDEEPLILQAHMDMVCEQNQGTGHDFASDSIELVREGDRIRAKGTSLGADNGLGVAFIMAVLADGTLPHPAIEAVFTADEETDMAGAWALNLGALRGRTLVNLDAPAVTICGSGEMEVAMRFVPELVPVRRGWKF
ncbi:MAG TPA: aminoacyl-histidine dipeptidase, partial [Synergistaceae bacterium]|nr:aminoacyl-histidine dipeptidase [Synergistaceae bacterium]